MPRLLFVAAILAMTLAACGSASGPPSQAAGDPTPIPRLSPTPLATPARTANPTPTPSPIATPRPAATPAVVTFTAKERYLQRGILRDAVACQPVRDDLPKQAVAGIECASKDNTVARIGFYLFKDDAAMLAAYFARMDAEGVGRDTGACLDEEGEGAFIPGEEEVASRYGCFVNTEGYANLRLTLPGSHVYVGVLGRNADMRALADFIYRGNADVPGFPTIWAAAEA